MDPEAQAVEPKTTDQPTTEVQEPAVPATEPTAQGQASGPWTKDLEGIFTDEDVRSQVDTFLRDKVQPYVTQLEQRSKPSEDVEAATELYHDLREDPGSTYLAITEELFGPDAAATIQQSLLGVNADNPQDDLEYVSGDFDDDQTLPPRVARAVEAIEQREAAEQYDKQMSAVQTKDPEVDADLFHPFVVSAQGDFDAAYQGYRQWLDSAKSKLGVSGDQQVDAQAVADAVTQGAPPVLGSDSQAPTAPPTQKNYTSIDDALEDFFAEQRGTAPPVVGSV